jgi:molybdenum cofactor cytidylyltransferase
MIPGLVLAAGASSRMGRPKALLPLAPEGTFLGRVLATLAGAGVDPLVVIAREALDVRAAWPDPRAGAVRVVVNPSPDRGQLSSLLCGLDALDAPPAVLVTLVDVPLASRRTVSAVIDAWQRSGAPLVRPTTGGRHGHPVIFSGPLLAALRSADPVAGAKPVVRAFEASQVNVPVDDPGILEDIDTPADYERLVGPLPEP